MPTIKIDYNSESQAATFTPEKDCPENTWSQVRRLFEERYPELVENQYRSLSIPWWAFLSIRNAFRYVLRISGVTSLNTTEPARRLLLEARQRAEQYARAEELREVRTPEDVALALASLGFERVLLPYQLRNVARLCNLPAGATFSVPGAGKTTEALAYYFLTRDLSDKVLVIAPKNAFVAWEDELPACFPDVDFNFVRLTGGQPRISQLLQDDPMAVIISYHQLPRVMNELASYLIRNHIYMFIDESHRMKRGASGVHGSSILSLAHLPKRKLLLSGTPMPNSPDDLVAQFNYLYPENAVSSDQVIDRFRRIFVRTTKSELGLIPPHRLLRWVPMTPAQQRLYSALATDAGRHLQGLSVSDRLRFRRFARCVQYMIQAASNPSLLVSSSLVGHELLTDVIAEGVSSKLQCASSLARDWVTQGHKVLIWSTFVSSVEHLAGLLSDVGAEFIHGGVATSEDPDAYDTREAKIRDFNEPSSNCRVLVANPAACSEGISLHHVCHRAIYVDRNYNAAHYLQSEDRIHRIGLSPDVQTYITILCSPGTIDESVDRRLKAKVSSMQTVLDDPDLCIQPLDLDVDDDVQGLDAEDIEDLRQMLRIET